MRQTFESINTAEKQQYVSNCVQLLLGLAQGDPALAQVVNADAAQSLVDSQAHLPAGQRTISQFFADQAAAATASGSATPVIAAPLSQTQPVGLATQMGFQAAPPPGGAP